MSDTILAGDITVFYLDDNRRKQLVWTGAATGTQSANAIYSAMADLLDEPTTGDDATCMFADTPVEYTTGIIDANDGDPWYMGYELMQHVTGGSIKTNGWNRVETTNTGVIVVPVNTGSTIVAGDVGFDITTTTDGDNGTLLEVLTPVAGGTEYLVIRPDTSAAGDSFDNSPTAGGAITCNAHSATQTSASNTGEQIWPNLYNVTPIDGDTHVYMYQGTVDDATRARIADVNDDSLDWWPEGAFDRLFYANDYSVAGFPVIDAGYITVLARKGSTLYDSFEVLTSLTSGGRNPVPLSASADSNNTVGYQSITQTASAGNWNVGDEIEGDSSGARAIITQIDNPGATQTVHYYLIGDPQTTFNTTAETLTNNDDTGTGTKNTSAPAAQGPALAAWFTSNTIPTAVHANTTSDINDDGVSEGYGILLDAKSNPFSEVYPWSQYVTRNGANIAAANTDGVEGEQYVGPTVYLEYSGTVTGTISEGSDVTQATSLATGIVLSHDTTLKQILLRDVRGEFTTADIVTDNDVGGTVTPNTAAEAFNANKASPFGSFAGGRWFFARGVAPVNWVGADENSFETLDSQGNVRTRPIAITLSVSNTVGGAETEIDSDLVWMHRLIASGGAIDKTEYSSDGTGATGGSSVVVDTAITADTPGKSAGGVLNIRDVSDNNQHYRLRFATWATSTFALAAFGAFTSTAGGSTTQINYATGGFNAALKRGDLVWNSTRSLASYVVSVDSDTQVTISPAITGQVDGDNIDFNVLPIALDTLDDVYVSLIDQYADSSSVSVSIVYVAPIFYRVKCANTRNADKIKRFVNDGSTSGTDQNTPVIRNADTIIN